MNALRTLLNFPEDCFQKFLSYRLLLDSVGFLNGWVSSHRSSETTTDSLPPTTASLPPTHKGGRGSSPGRTPRTKGGNVTSWPPSQGKPCTYTKGVVIEIRLPREKTTAQTASCLQTGTRSFYLGLPSPRTVVGWHTVEMQGMRFKLWVIRPQLNISEKWWWYGRQIWAGGPCHRGLGLAVGLERRHQVGKSETTFFMSPRPVLSTVPSIQRHPFHGQERASHSIPAK